MVARGIARQTRDLDLPLSGQRADGVRLASALVEIDVGFAARGIPDLASVPGRKLTVNATGVRGVDLLTSVDGIDFEQAYLRADDLLLHGVACRVAALEDLIVAKRLSHQACVAKANTPGLTAKATDAYRQLAARDEQDLTALHARRGRMVR